MFVRNALFLFLLLTASVAAVAQQRTSLKGTVADSATKELMEMATVSVQDVKDSSLLTYTLTDRKGSFSLTGLPASKPVRLLISYTGYRTFIKVIGTDSPADLGQITLAVAARELNTVVIASEAPPVVVRKDTIEFNAAAFKARPNAVLEEMLKKLPGVDIDQEGKITMNGKPVSRILVEGRDFFGNDTKLTMKNLPANIIDKVQVMDTKSRQEAKMGVEKDGEDKTINLTLKPDKKKGIFGRIAAGAGTEKRFELTGMVNGFNGGRQISVLGGSNNLNKQGFTQSEIMSVAERKGGGMSMSFSSDGGMNINGINFGTMGDGIRTASMLGYNYNDEWNKKTIFNNSYFFNNTDAKFNTLTNNLYNDGRNVIGNRNGTSRNASHNVNLSIELPLDSLTTLSVSPKFSYGKQTSNSTSIDSTYRDLNDLANSTKGANTSLMKRTGFDNTINLTRILSKKGRSIGLNFTNSYYVQEGNARNYSEQHFFENNVLDSTQILNQQNIIDGRNERYDAHVNYSEPLSKTMKLLVSYRYTYALSISNRNTYNYDETSKGYTDLDSLYTNRFRTATTTQQPNLAFNYNSKNKKLNASFGGSVYFNTLENKSYLDNTTFSQRTTNIAPTSRLQYTLNNKGNVMFNYNGYMNQPSLEQLQPVRDNTNPLNVRLGNPDLKPSFNHNISVGYNKFSMTGLGIYSSASFSPTINRISTITRVSSNGGQTIQYINVDGTFSSYANVNINYNKKTKDAQIRFNGGFFGNLSKNKNYSNINNVKGDTTVRENVSTNWSVTPMINASYSYKEIFDFTLNYRPTFNQVLSKLNNVTTSNFSQRLSAGATLYWPLGFILENDLTYTYNSRTAPGFKKGIPVYSAAIGYEFLKNRAAQVKVYGYDLFRQNTNIRRYVSELGTFDTRTDLIEQYFMLTFTYNISAFGAKAKSTRRADNRPFFF